MLPWPPSMFRRGGFAPTAHDPGDERRVAERLLPVARQVLIAPGADDPCELLGLAEALAPAGRTEVLTPSTIEVAVLRRLLARDFAVYDTAAAPSRSLLILDRRLGWRLPDWEPLPQAFKTTCRLLWSRLGYYTFQVGTVAEVHAENRLFSFAERRIWVNIAYSELPLPQPGQRLRVLGMVSFLGSTLPILHALAIEPHDRD